MLLLYPRVATLPQALTTLDASPHLTNLRPLRPLAHAPAGLHAVLRRNTGAARCELAMVVLVEDPCLGCRSELVESFPASRLCVDTDQRLRAGEAVTHPRSVCEHQLEPVSSDHASNFAAAELGRITA